MNTSTIAFIEIWKEERTRFLGQLKNLSETDLQKKIAPTSNSIGFLIRHIGDVELLFAKNIFGAEHLKIKAKTVMRPVDTGEWINLDALIRYVEESGVELLKVLTHQQEEDWASLVSTKEFGTRTKQQALGRISSHTAYHTGQIALIKKYGQSFSS